jgi:hypothetical protein
MEKVNEQLRELQKKTIGLFKRGFDKDVWLVVENYNGTLTCVSITPLSAMHTLTINIKEGEYLSFGGQSLYEIKDDVYAFNELYTNFIK